VIDFRVLKKRPLGDVSPGGLDQKNGVADLLHLTLRPVSPMVTAELVIQSAKALLMSAGGGLAARKGLEALGLKTADPLFIADDHLLTSLTPEELQLYLLEEPHEPLTVGLLPEPDQLVEPPSLFTLALKKTLAEPFVLSADRLSPAALVAWACGAAAALLFLRLVSFLRARSQGPHFCVRISESTEGPAAVDVRGEAFVDDGWRHGSWVDLGAYRWRCNALAKGQDVFASVLQRPTVMSALLVYNPQ